MQIYNFFYIQVYLKNKYKNIILIYLENKLLKIYFINMKILCFYFLVDKY